MANTKITNPELFNLGDSTSATQLPVMTTTERVAMTGLSIGEMIFNSTTDKVEYWDGTKWYGITYEVTAESPYNNVLYTGSGDTTNGQSITGIGFKPDLLWFKSTGTTYYNVLYDSIRGTNAAISSNLVNSTYSNYNRLQSFDNDGFTIKANNTADLWKIDRSSQPFVAWCFKAGGAAVANTNGNIASQVSANVDGGFSIVKWSGNDTTGGTIGHGLSSTPELTIIKKTSATANWQVSLNASVTGVEGYMNLDANAALYTTYPLYYTSSNSTVLSSNGTSTGTRLYNNQSANYIAYAFHSVAGYSKMGSYVGNGSATGPIITLGFEPAFVMVKNTTGTGLWLMSDNKRQTAATKTTYLQAQSSDAEYSPYTWIEYLSNGFQLKNTGSSLNTNGSTYIFMAFAVDPT